MLCLKKSLSAWQSEDFEKILADEISQLKVDQLPLQQGLSVSNYALDDNLKVVILNVTNDDDCIHVKAGIFYSGVIAGCNCADDPSPVETQPEYCEVQLAINKSTAETGISLLAS